MTPSSSVDIGSVVDRLGEVSQVEEAEIREGSVRLWFQDQLIYIRLLDADYGDRSQWIDDSDVDRLLALVGERVLEVDGSQVYAYDLWQDLDDEKAIVERLIDVLAGTAERQRLNWDELKDVLAAGDVFVHDTPRQIAEIVAGWAITDSSERVLDIATGLGTLFAEAAEQLATTTNASHQLVGFDNDLFACKLTRSRLQDIETAEIINTDFFEWNPEQGTDSEQASLTETAEAGASPKFDAVIGTPPAVPLERLSAEQREQLQDWAPGRGRHVGAAFVTKAVTHLKVGGRAAFVLPKFALRDRLLEHLMSTCALHRIVTLPLGSFAETRQGCETVILTLVKEERSPEVRETGVAKFNRMELPDNARGLFEQPLDEILANRYNTFDAEIVKAAHEDLDGETVMRLLSSPSIYDILTKGDFTRLGDLKLDIEVGSWATSGNDRLFYFDKEERQASGIDDRFFRPLIKDLPDSTRSITADEINQYVLDLQPIRL